MKKATREINIFSMSALDLFASALGAFILITVMLFPYFPNTGDSPERVAAVRARLQQAQQQLQQAQQELQQSQQQLQQAQQELQQSQQQLQQAQQAQQELQQAQQELQQSRQQLQQAQQQLQQAQRQLQQAQQKNQQVQQLQADLGVCRSSSERTRNELESCQQQARRRFLLILMSWSGRDDVDLHLVDPQGREFYFSQKTHAGTRAKLEEDNIQGPGNEIWLHPQTLPGEYKVYYNLYAKRSSRIGVRGAMLTPEGKINFPDRVLSVQGRKILAAVIRVDNQGNITLRSL